MNEKKVRKTEYHIHRFMYSLGIKNSALCVYAALYSFTVGRRGLFHGSQKYLAASLGISVRTLQNALVRLFSLELIERCESEDGRYRGIRCASLAELERAKKANLATEQREKNENKASQTPKNTEAKKDKALPVAQENVTRQLRMVDELCERINRKISASAPKREPIRPQTFYIDERYIGKDAAEHEKNTYIMMRKYERHGDNRRFMSFGKSGGVIMTEPQYRTLLSLLPTEELMPYFVKFENMLTENTKTGRKPPHSHYKTIRKWIEEDTAL